TGIWYFPSSQLPRSISLQRSLQNGYHLGSGSSGPGSATGFLQVGHFIITPAGASRRQDLASDPPDLPLPEAEAPAVAFFSDDLLLDDVEPLEDEPLSLAAASL